MLACKLNLDWSATLSGNPHVGWKLTHRQTSVITSKLINYLLQQSLIMSGEPWTTELRLWFRFIMCVDTERGFATSRFCVWLRTYVRNSLSSYINKWWKVEQAASRKLHSKGPAAINRPLHCTESATNDNNLELPLQLFF